MYARGGVIRAFVIVDAADYDELNQRRWNLRDDGYAGAATPGRFQMHRVILGLRRGDPRQADHRNGDRLDNRRANLRIVTHAQNQQNKPGVQASSRFRGVNWRAQRGVWRAEAQLAGRKRHIGQFATELDAAIAAEAFRREHMPFAEPDPVLVAALAEQDAQRVA